MFAFLFSKPAGTRTIPLLTKGYKDFSSGTKRFINLKRIN